MSRAVLITGASGGIGRRLCEAFREAGFVVVGLDIAADGFGCDHFLSIDLERLAGDKVYRRQSLATIQATLAPYELHVLINNAATQRLGPFDAMPDEDWEASLAVNLSAPFFLAQGLLPLLERAHGSIVNIGSIHARLTKPRFVAYATSKAALEGFTRALAVELGPRVRVNAISPAATATPMLRAGLEPTAYDALSRLHPIGRIALPEEIARTAVLLASDAFGFMTGAVVSMDGGIAARLHDPE